MQNQRIGHQQYHSSIHFVTVIGFHKNDGTHSQVTQQANLVHEEHFDVYVQKSWIKISSNNSITSYPACNQQQQYTKNSLQYAAKMK